MVYTDKIHLIADTLDELHKFAVEIGMSPGWFQRPPKVKYPHYDLMGMMIDRAIKAGAKVVDTRTLVRIVRLFVIKEK